jgi:hypothetical protein
VISVSACTLAVGDGVPQESPSTRNFFSEIIASISDIKFNASGRYILSRDYLTLKLWDINMESAPVKTFRVHEHLRAKVRALSPLLILLPHLAHNSTRSYTCEHGETALWGWTCDGCCSCRAGVLCDVASSAVRPVRERQHLRQVRVHAQRRQRQRGHRQLLQLLSRLQRGHRPRIHAGGFQDAAGCNPAACRFGCGCEKRLRAQHHDTTAAAYASEGAQSRSLSETLGSKPRVSLSRGSPTKAPQRDSRAASADGLVTLPTSQTALAVFLCLHVSAG